MAGTSAPPRGPTGIACGRYPGNEKFTENGRSAGTGIMQGVRQLGPSEVFASAPGGSDSIVNETFAPPERPGTLGIQSQLGVQEAQPARQSALAMAHTRTTGVISKLRPRSPRLPGRTIRGRRCGCNRGLPRSAAAAPENIVPSRCNL